MFQQSAAAALLLTSRRSPPCRAAQQPLQHVACSHAASRYCLHVTAIKAAWGLGGLHQCIQFKLRPEAPTSPGFTVMLYRNLNVVFTIGRALAKPWRRVTCYSKFKWHLSLPRLRHSSQCIAAPTGHSTPIGNRSAITTNAYEDQDQMLPQLAALQPTATCQSEYTQRSCDGCLDNCSALQLQLLH
jgi:hypothetical protein